MENQSAAQKPSFVKRALPIVVVIIVVFLLLRVMGTMKEPPTVIPDRPTGFLVETQTLKPTTLIIEVQSQGKLEPKQEIALLAEVSGKVTGLNPAFQNGGHFNQGDVLVQIDRADYQVAVERARANLASAQANLDLEQARSDQAQKDWNSFGKKGTPSDLLLNIPQLNGAKASLKAAKADLKKAERDLSKTEIKAPFDGTVISKSVDLGQFLTMSGQVGQIAGTATGEVRLPLSNQDLMQLQLSNQSLLEAPVPVQFHLDGEMTIIPGQVARVESSKDSRTLMNYAVAEITDPFGHGLLFNTFLQANLQGEHVQDVYAIPSAWMMPNDQIAVYHEGNEKAQGTLTIQDVQVIHQTKDLFYVQSGIGPLTQVITTPIQAPTVGMTLRRNQEIQP